MPSVADIWNMALSHVGADANVVSTAPPDSSVEAGYCNRFWPIARKLGLESHPWTWAKTRGTLAAVTNPSTTWAYAYALPSDCVRPLRVLQSQTVTDFIGWPWLPAPTADELQLWSESGSALFQVEDGVLLAHEPDAVLLYTRDITDTTKYSTGFTMFVGYLLASYIGPPIVKGVEGIKLGRGLLEMATLMGKRAAAEDANRSSETSEYVPDAIRRRQ
jgi:hypothetical protein